jgi:regulator of protease activity HflC (stomatin/prohibitin superfamily)
VPAHFIVLLSIFVAGVASLIALHATFFKVEQSTCAIVQRLGKFSRESGTGRQIKVPFFEQIAGRITLQTQHLDLEVETSTSDQVLVRLAVIVHYYVRPDRISEAFYSLDDIRHRLDCLVFSLVADHVQGICLDDVFENTDEIARLVSRELEWAIRNLSYGTAEVRVKVLAPGLSVQELMHASLGESIDDASFSQSERLAALQIGEEHHIRLDDAEGGFQ